LEESFAALPEALSALVKPDGVKAVWNAFLSGKTSWSRPWSLFVLYEWARRQESSPTS
jgi:hypothetical protein